MNGQYLDHLARLLGSGADRRLLLKGLAGGAVVGGGLKPARSSSAAPDALVPRPQEGQCRYLMVFSKKLSDDLRIDDRSCDKPCACPDQKEVVASRHVLLGQLYEYPCDETQRAIPDGSTMRFTLTHYLKFNDQGQLVGYHEGTFEITSAAGGRVMSGRVEGLDGLNSETGDCEPGRIEGHLQGTRGSDPFAGCTLVADYRFQFDMPDPCPDNWSTGGGFITGVFSCPCGDMPCNGEPTCVDFTGEPEGPVPPSFSVGAVTFSASGAASPRIWGVGGYVGLDVGHTLKIDLPPSCRVELVLVHAATPATITAYGAAGVVGTDTMTPDQLVPQTFTYVGSGISQIVVDAPQDETILLSVCYTTP